MIILKEILVFMWNAFLHIWPYLLLTVPLAVVINLTGLSKYINRVFSANPMVSIILATVLGAFSPFCSCGVIPVIASLLMSGVPIAPVMSFWLASPSMDPEVFFLSVSTLGWNLAVWRLAGTFVMSLSAGYITHFLFKRGWLGSDFLRKKNESSCGCGPKPISEGSVCSVETAVKTSMLIKIKDEIIRSVTMVAKFMGLAFFLEAVIILYLPQELVVAFLGRDNHTAVLFSALAGVPMYTTNITALGLIGGLVKQGMNGGAALAFLISGATTTIPAMAAVYGLTHRRIFVLYLGLTFFWSLCIGTIYNAVSVFS